MDFSSLLNLDKQTVFIYFPLFMGIILFLINFRLLYKSTISESWSRTNGIVIKSQLDESGTGGEDSITYKPDIQYQYEVEQKLYDSKRLYFGSNISSSFKKRKSTRLVQKYSTGTEVIVYYNQSNPKESVIETGIHSEIWIGFIVVALLCISGYVAMLHPEFYN
jgi:hypothetical protein